MCADSLYHVTVSIILDQFKYVHKYERVRESSFFPSTIFLFKNSKDRQMSL